MIKILVITLMVIYFIIGAYFTISSYIELDRILQIDYDAIEHEDEYTYGIIVNILEALSKLGLMKTIIYFVIVIPIVSIVWPLGVYYVLHND